MRWVKLNLQPDSDLGWFLGTIVGDGNVCRYAEKKNKTVHYFIRFETSKDDYFALFAKTVRRRFPALHPFVGHRTRVSTFHGVRETKTAYMQITSKPLYNLLRPCKLSDSVWDIPRIVFQSDACLRGFLQGLYDAEGSVKYDAVVLYSKHASNLAQIFAILKQRYGLDSTLAPHRTGMYYLMLSGTKRCEAFEKEIGFRLLRKAEPLAQMLDYLLLKRKTVGSVKKVM